MEDLKISCNPNDISSYSNFDKIKQKEIYIDAFVNFDKKQFEGDAIITFDIIDKNENKLILDCKKLEISKIESLDLNKELNYIIYKKNEDQSALGTPLIISLSEELLKKSEIKIKIKFIVNEGCDAVKFMEPFQTKTKKYPFMFTQFQAILCRTFIPCQDSPGVKVKVFAKVKVIKPLIVLFSGIETKKYSENDYNIFEFEQKVPIPTYLIAFAAGELEYGKISDRCGVWTEIGLKDIAVREFESAELFLKTAEEYLTPYQWGVYNILVLPTPFPYGGMENPCLTFVTNALLVGDKSMANVIAHEISHSWTGNLVTNKDWANFWVNEGFTTFMQRKITELIYGEDMSNLEAQVGIGELNADIEIMGNNTNFTRLAPDFSHIDPDDGFCTVPYEKGFTFLYFLETLVGKENFKNIMRKYINKYSFKSVDYSAFQEVFENYVKDIYKDKANEEIFKKINWDEWLYSTGKLIKTFPYKTKYIDEAHELAEKFLKEEKDPNFGDIFKKWNNNIKLVFLNYLMDNIKRINDNIYINLRDILKLHGNYNSETQYIWYQIALITKHDDCIDFVKKFLLSNGRIKYVKPVYFEWYKFQKDAANEFFSKNKNIYHQVVSRLVEETYNKWNKEGLK